MAPSFFSKLVKPASSVSHSRERSDRSFESSRSPSPKTRSRTVSAASPGSNFSSISNVSRSAMPSSINTKPVINVPDSDDGDGDANNPSVTIIPPSPHSTVDGGRKVDGLPNVNGSENGPTTVGLPSTTNHSRSYSSPSSSTARDNTIVPPLSQGLSSSDIPSRPPSRPNTASSSKSNIREAFISAFGAKDPSTSPEMRTKASNKSLKNQPAPISTSDLPIPPNMSRADSNESSVSGSAIVESPTSIVPPEFPSANGKAPLTTSPTRNGSVIAPTTPPNEKKRQTGKWKRPTQKPTGLASAIAASGLAMANPALSVQQQQHHQAQLSPPVPSSRKSSLPAPPPYLNRVGSGSAVSASGSTHTRMGSSEFSPPKSKDSRRRGASVNSDHGSEYFGDGIDYYSGLDDSSEEDDSDEEDILSHLNLGSEVPVTGFAVANSRRNADFHELFPNIPEGDYLIEDYGCALQREILIQGRLYISENHICFHANIFGWITDLSIPIYEITSLEKKMTAFVIPNAIQITTRQNKYSFASFLSRDTTYDVIHNIWRLSRPGDAHSVASAERAGDRVMDSLLSDVGGTAAAGPVKKMTQCQCGKDSKHYTEKALEMVVPGSPEKIYALMFASGFMKEFLVVNQKLLDIQVSDWAPIEDGSKLLARNMSYIKPLNGSVGPKQTKCEIRDETEHCNFEDYISTVTTTRTPDVPSGGVFSVKTRTCIMWASEMSAKVLVTTQVDWTGRSFIKGIIERSAIDGQKVYHTALEKAMRGYIQDHQSEFVPEGVDPAVLVAEILDPALPEASSPDAKQREHERNQRAFQWAWDTFEGTMSVAKQSVKGALELIREAWEQSSSTTILYFLVVALLLSNIYTYVKMGSKEESGRRKILQANEEKDKWIHGVVAALKEELAVGGAVGLAVPGSQASVASESPMPEDQRDFNPLNIGADITVMTQTLDEMEARIRSMKAALQSLTHIHDASDLD